MKIKLPKTAAKQKTGPLLSVREVAVLDNCSEKTVRRAIDAGLLEVVRVGPSGRLVRIEPADHLAYRQRYKS